MKKDDFMSNGSGSGVRMNRRTFVKSSLAAGAVLGSGLSLTALAPIKEAGAAPADRAGQWKPANCQGCTSWCAKQVYVVDGRAVRVRGNPHSKVNMGASCPEHIWACSRSMTRTGSRCP